MLLFITTHQHLLQLLYSGLFSYSANFHTFHTSLQFEDHITCYVHVGELAKIKHVNISNNWFIRKFAPTKIPTTRYLLFVF